MDHADSHSSFGILLRRCRLADGLTQELLAERSGVAKRTLQALESDAARPRRETVRRLIAALQPLPETRAVFEAAVSAPRRHPGTARPPRADAGPGGTRSHPDLPKAQSREAATSRRPTPLRLTSFVGREREIADVTRLLQACRLLTLTGSGGCGKTRLALELADRLAPSYPDGIFVVWLVSIGDPSLVASSVAQALGIQEEVGEPFLETLARRIGTRRALLVIDNFEHLLPAASMLTDLLAACPGLVALVTSREVLRVRGEQVYPVAPLTLPAGGSPFDPEQDIVSRVSESEAGRLFVDRAMSAHPAFQLDAPAATAVAQICLRLDGLPLAIELAAARVRLLPPEIMVRRLEPRLPLLTGGARDLPARQRTLRDTIAWSYDLLAEAERRLFQRLAVFVGGCTLEAAEAVCGIDGDLGLDVLDGITSLTDKSLLRTEAGPDGEPRVTMLETIREYGLEQVHASGDETTIRRRHLMWACDVAKRGQVGMHGPDGVRWIDRLAADHDNFRAALAWSLADSEPASRRSGLVMAGALTNFWMYREHLQEGRRWSEQLLQADDAVHALNGPPGAGPPSAPDRIDTSTPVRIGAFGVHPRVIVLNGLSGITRRLGERELARSTAHSALELARRMRDPIGEAIACIHLGNTYRDVGEFEQALPHLETALAIGRSIGQPFSLWMALSNLGLILVNLGQGDRGRALLDEALAFARRTGHPGGVNQALRFLGVEALQRGDVERATSLLTESLNGFRAMGDSVRACETGWVLGYASLAANDPYPAIDRFMESAALCREPSDRRRLGLALQGLSAAVLAASDISAAWCANLVRLLGGACRLREGAPNWFPALEHSVHDRAMAAARDRLGDEAFDAAWSEGQTLSLDQLWALVEDLVRQIRVDVPASAPPG